MPNAEETEMGLAVQRTREALKALLTPDEWKTKRASGSEFPRTCEDAAREISESDDPRASAVGAALRDFQGAINTFWEYTVENGMPRRRAELWIKQRFISFDGLPGTEDDAVSEAMLAMRRAIVRFNPTKGSIWGYSGPAITQALVLWYSRLRAPLELPEKQALTHEGISRAPLDEHHEYREDRYVE